MNRREFWPLALGAGVLLNLAQGAILQIKPSSLSREPSSTEFLYEDGRIYVPVRIGRDSARWFILDTGATQTVLDTTVARSAGVRLAGESVVSGAGSGSSKQMHGSKVTLQIGATCLVVSEPAVTDLAHLLGPTSGRAPAGIIGSQFFREHFVDIDFRTRQIRWYPPASDRRSDYASAVPLTFVDWTPLTAVDLTLPNGARLAPHALVDLGAKSMFLIPEPYIDRVKLRERFAKTVISGLGAGMGGDTFYAFTRARRLSLGAAPSLGIDRPVVGLSVGGTLRSTWHEGLLGVEFLSRFRLGFDYQHKRLLLTQRSYDPEPFDRSGMFLAAEGKDLKHVKIRQILKGSPAEAAGLAVGDELLSVNGQPVAAMQLASIRRLLKAPSNTTARIIFIRAAEQQSTVLHLREFL